MTSASPQIQPNLMSIFLNSSQQIVLARSYYNYSKCDFNTKYILLGKILLANDQPSPQLFVIVSSILLLYVKN